MHAVPVSSHWELVDWLFVSGEPLWGTAIINEDGNAEFSSREDEAHFPFPSKKRHIAFFYSVKKKKKKKLVGQSKFKQRGKK